MVYVYVYAMPLSLLLTRRHLFAGMAAPALNKTQPVAAKPILVPVVVPVAEASPMPSKIIDLSTSYYLQQSLTLGKMATEMLEREDIDGFYQRTFLSKLLEAYDASVQLIEDDFIHTIMQRGLVHPMANGEDDDKDSGRFV